MHLVMPGLADLPRKAGGVAIYDIAPGATFEIHPFVPLPPDLANFGREIVFGDEPDAVRVTIVTEDKTALGWPVTIAASERRENGNIVEYRVHLVFQFIDYGAVAVLRASSDEACRAALAIIKPLVDSARPDFATEAVPALAMLWAGL